MSYISHLSDDWKQTLSAQTKKRQDAEKELKPLKDEFDAYDKQKPEGLFGKLKHQMIKNVGLAPLREKIGQAETKIGNATYAITKKAKDTYQEMADYAMTHPSCAGLVAQQDMNGRAIALLNAGLESIANTLQACKTACETEQADINTKNGITHITSFQNTKFAKEQLRATNALLKNLSKQIQDISSGEDMLDNIGRDCMLDASDMYSDSRASEILSMMNWMQLDRAMQSLKKTQGVMKGHVQTLERRQAEAVGQAIGFARAADPEIDALAASLTPHLPGELASRMTKRGPTPPRP